MRKLGLLLAVLGLASACDDDNPARHLDGGMIDSPTQMIDAPNGPSPVTLTVKYGGVGREGVVVHFQNADSTLVATEMTDANGVAKHVMNAGGYVTAIDAFPIQVPQGLPPSGPSHELRTIAGVKPGDKLRMEQSVRPDQFQMTMTLPVQIDPNIHHYDVATSCGNTYMMSSGSGSNTSGPVYFTLGCTAPDILVTARTLNGQALSYFYVPAQAVSANGTLDYSAKTLGSPDSRTFSLGDEPAGFSSFTVKQQVLNTKGFLDVYSAAASSGSASTATVAFANIPNGLGIVEVDGGNNTSQFFTLDWGPLSTNAFTTDFGARMLKGPSQVAFDAATHAVTWTESSGVTPEFVSVDITGTRLTTTSNKVAWTIVAPYTAGTTTLPTIPVGSFDFNFTQNDLVNVDTVQLGKLPGGFETARPLYFGIESPFDMAMGATGSAAFSSNANLAFARPKPAVLKAQQLQHRTQSTR